MIVIAPASVFHDLKEKGGRQQKASAQAAEPLPRVPSETRPRYPQCLLRTPSQTPSVRMVLRRIRRRPRETARTSLLGGTRKWWRIWLRRTSFKDCGRSSMMRAAPAGCTPCRWGQHRCGHCSPPWRRRWRCPPGWKLCWRMRSITKLRTSLAVSCFFGGMLEAGNIEEAAARDFGIIGHRYRVAPSPWRDSCSA